MKWAAVIHGGAGNASEKLRSDPEEQQRYHQSLKIIIEKASRLLMKGESAVDVVEAVVRDLENDPLYNAGHGSVPNEDGHFLLESSIMTSTPTPRCGAITEITDIKNPISAARWVMDNSPHCFLNYSSTTLTTTTTTISSSSSKWKEKLAQNVEIVADSNPPYYWTERRWQDYLKWKKTVNDSVPLSSAGIGKFETVGAVVLDMHGGLCAGTSTGGRLGKYAGRIGDSPIIGSGTFCNIDVGISGTGFGEAFIKNVLAYDIAARYKYQFINDHKDSRLESSVTASVTEALEIGQGGVIAIDKSGNIVTFANTEVLFQAKADSSGLLETLIFTKP